VTPERPRNEKNQNPLLNASFIALLEGRAYEVIAISIGVAMANLAKASVIGGISANASLMKMNEAAQMQTIVPANAKDMRVLCAYLSVRLILQLPVRRVILRPNLPAHTTLTLNFWDEKQLENESRTFKIREWTYGFDSSQV
jgi:hypothetical protein